MFLLWKMSTAVGGERELFLELPHPAPRIERLVESFAGDDDYYTDVPIGYSPCFLVSDIMQELQGEELDEFLEKVPLIFAIMQNELAGYKLVTYLNKEE